MSSAFLTACDGIERAMGAATIEIRDILSLFQTRTVDMTIAKLRQKIERDATDPKIVVTVTGAGYAWGED